MADGLFDPEFLGLIVRAPHKQGGTDATSVKKLVLPGAGPTAAQNILALTSPSAGVSAAPLVAAYLRVVSDVDATICFGATALAAVPGADDWPLYANAPQEFVVFGDLDAFFAIYSAAAGGARWYLETARRS